MRIIYGINKIRKFRKPVVALGVFDGVHQGHRKILKAALITARRIKGTSLVLTFWPHPQKEKMLYSLEHRLRLIASIGIDVCIVIRFNRAFSRLSAEDFIRDILVKKIRANYICVGRNFRFGNKAEGNLGVLERLSRIYNFKLKVCNVLKINNRFISSTAIRNLITSGDLKSAKKLLSRPVSVLGTVIQGDYRARTLGFPTANINPHHEITPPAGVYAVWVFLDGKRLRGICYIGRKPTFIKSHQTNLQDLKHIEVHIFGFQRKIYGRCLEIQFVKKIRNERKFSSGILLAKQVRKDIFFAQRIFSRH